MTLGRGPKTKPRDQEEEEETAEGLKKEQPGKEEENLTSVVS